MTAPKAQGRRDFIEAASRVCALSALGLLLGRPAWADDAGLALARKVYDRADGEDASSVVTMALTEEGRSPRERSPSISLKRCSGSTTTPFPMTFRTPAWRIPQGIRFKTKRSPFASVVRSSSLHATPALAAKPSSALVGAPFASRPMLR